MGHIGKNRLVRRILENNFSLSNHDQSKTLAIDHPNLSDRSV
jgi:hypothetical protein